MIADDLVVLDLKARDAALMGVILLQARDQSLRLSS